MLDTQAKGNIAEMRVTLALYGIRPYIKSVYKIPNEQDTNHWDLMVTLNEASCLFAVQVKALSKANLTLEMNHIIDWLKAGIVTVPIWWDEVQQKAFWADILRYLIRTGGIGSRKTATFAFPSDFHELNIKNTKSKQRFLRWIQERCRIWPLLRSRAKEIWPLNSEFPVSLIEVVLEPHVLMCLPLSTNLVNMLEDYLGNRIADRSKLITDVFRAGTISIDSPKSAAEMLAREYGISTLDWEIRENLTRGLHHWAERMRAIDGEGAKTTLWAFDKLISLISYKERGDLQFPAFTTKYTYPMGRLVSLLPAEVLWEPLVRILTKDNNLQLLLHVAYYLSLLNYPSTAEASKYVEDIRLFGKHEIGVQSRIVERQLLNTEVILGSEKAKHLFIHYLKDRDGLRFDAPYNYYYFQRDPKRIRERFEIRLEENLRKDRNVREIISLQYDYIRKSLKESNAVLRKMDPNFWPSK